MKPAKRLAGIDYDAFGAAVFAMRDELEATLSAADYRHLRRIILVNRLFTLLGYATAWLPPNPLTVYCLSQGIFGRWLVMHHVSHGGYDKVPGIPRRYTSPVFAMGWRRFVDWFDWIYPPAWHREHNVLHHYHTSESNDPDLVEDLSAFLRQNRWPCALKYLFVLLAAVSWKFTYYAPNTLLTLDDGAPRQPVDSLWRAVWRHAFDLRRLRVRQLWLACYLPYFLVSFVILPLAFLPLGRAAVACVLINRLLAELLTNLHAFVVIAPNHAGADLYRFDYHFRGKGEYAVNQVVSSCNYHCGSPVGDYLQIWLNYQIEHHLYPKLPMLKYREVQPRIRDLCRDHHVPYVQQSVWQRLWRCVSIMVGHDSMKWLRDDPASLSPAATSASAPLGRSLAAEQVDASCSH